MISPLYLLKGKGPMRIMYVLTSLGIGGAEKQALEVAERMKRRGHAVALMVLRPQLEEEWPTTLDTIRLDMRKPPVRLFAGVSRARRHLRAFKPDLLHSHSFHANVFARCLKLMVPRLKVISTIHNVYEGGRSRMLAYRLTDPFSCLTIAVSEAVAQRFIQIRAVPAKKCLIITNGIDIAKFAPDPAHRARVRTRLGLEVGQSDFLWLAAGRVTPAKDYPNLLQAFSQVRERFPSAKLRIAGAPADAEVHRAAGGSESFLFGMSKGKDCSEHIHFLGLRRDMLALLDASDAFVSASAWEGMPLAVGEAMAMEKPVVATDVGGVHELVGDAGLVIPSQNSSALAEAMIATMQLSEDDRAGSGRAARQRIEQHFGIEARTDTWQELYRKMLS